MKINRSRVPNQCAFDRMVGTNLHYIRKYKKLTMIKVAEQIPFTFQQLQKYEKGVNTISAYKLVKLCNIYGVTIDRIVEPSFIEKHQVIKERLEDAAYFKEADSTFDAQDDQIAMIDKEQEKRSYR